MAGLSVSVLEALRAQYVHERHNSHKYTARACWANYYGLLNIEEFFKKQASDESGHADKIYAYITDRGERISHALPGVDEVFGESALDVFRSAFELEVATTEKLKAIYSLAQSEGDFLTAGWLLTGLLAEQVEEEDTFQTILDHLRMRLNETEATEFARDAAMMAAEPGAALHDLDHWIKDTYLG